MQAKLSALFARHGSDKNTGNETGHSYGPFYDELLTPLVGKIHSVLELGVLGGASLRAWRDFFPDCQVIGIDNSREPFEEWMISCRKADATNEEELNAVLGDKTFDLVCDDASHWADHQIKSFEILRSRVNLGGIWVIEDVQHWCTATRLKDMGFEIIDLRAVRSKFDDVLAVYRF